MGMAQVEILKDQTCHHLSELRALIEFFQVQHPEKLGIILEIGTYRGGTAWVWSHLAEKRVICVDLDFEKDGIAPVYRSRMPKVPIIEIKGDSADPVTFASVLSCLSNDPVDLLYIDGDHFYGPCRMDHLRYSPLVKPGGWIAFHDILNLDTQTPEFWKEVKAGHVFYEFVYQRQPVDQKETWLDPNKGLGIGLIRWWGGGTWGER